MNATSAPITDRLLRGSKQAAWLHVLLVGSIALVAWHIFLLGGPSSSGSGSAA